MTYTPDTPLEALAGIGPKKAQAFQKLGVATLRDLAGLYPRRYEDRTQFRTIAAAQPGEAVCIRATVAGEPRTQYVRSGLTLVKARIADDTGALDVTYFNQPYRKNSLHAGEEYIFYGKVEANGFRKTLTNPVCEQAARCGSAEFTIPFNRQQLADYLNLDRSALSKELCKMRDEGLLTFEKNRFALNELPE